jgi:hypothetical protein
MYLSYLYEHFEPALVPVCGLGYSSDSTYVALLSLLSEEPCDTTTLAERISQYGNLDLPSNRNTRPSEQRTPLEQAPPSPIDILGPYCHCKAKMGP